MDLESRKKRKLWHDNGKNHIEEEEEEEEEDEETKMEKFFALIRNIREIRHGLIENRNVEKKKTINAEAEDHKQVMGIWKPSFQLEDFSDTKEANVIMFINGGGNGDDNKEEDMKMEKFLLLLQSRGV
ncbi:protein NIM1-INTERACTING 3-like [Quillaja saponaria]|uniref:Protein NIM1-INTERACTING 3-like n=1 Tax=Quillaja saponaria TaxID=32244 RepID=A0AAD7Q1F9_QUISA|nr:protein NIM1-INTERACTING 3-like [Quillaja saponaria]